VSEETQDAPRTPFPWVLDVSVLTAVARADVGVTGHVLGLDAQERPVLIPALAVVGASLDSRGADATRALRGLGKLGSATIEPLQGTAQAVRLAAVIARTGLDPWDAHVALVADAKVCPILTLDAAKWREHAGDLDERLYFVEIVDPDGN
jgi:predicted nucleic acid-binding protein